MKKMLRQLTIILSLSMVSLLFVAMSLSTAANAQTALAEKAYDQGDFTEAIRLYESELREKGTNGHTYYNLGNSYFRVNQLGKAVAYYLAAREQMPRHPDVKANLKHTLDKIDDQLGVQIDQGIWGVVTLPLHHITSREYYWGVTCLFAVFGILLSIWAFFPHNLGLKRSTFVVLTAGICVLITCQVIDQSRMSWGAVLRNGVEARSDPSSSAKPIFKLNEGAPFALASATENWVEIKLSDGKSGWIRKTEALVVGL